MRYYHQHVHFGIRKLTIGVCSLAIGSILMGSTEAFATENDLVETANTLSEKDSILASEVSLGHTNVTPVNDMAEETNSGISNRSEQQEKLLGSIVDTNLQYTGYENDTVTELLKYSELTAWKNDTVNSQISLTTQNSALHNVRVIVSDFTNEKSSISSATAKAHFVKSIQAFTGHLGYGNPNRPLPEGQRAEAAEVLYQDTVTVIEPNQRQNLWLSVQVPKTAESGIYNGVVTVTADELTTPLTFQYRLEVLDAVLPDSENFKDRFDIELWQNPYAVAEYYGVEAFSKKHLEILKPHMEKYKAIGGHAVTTTIVEEAWGGQTYSKNNVKFPSMIKWTKKLDGTFTFDYTDFDSWVQFNKDLGIGDKIVAYSIAPWTSAVVYYNEATKTKETLRVRPGDEHYQKIWSSFLADFMVHTQQRGWKENIYIGIDERGFDNRAFDLIDTIRGIDGKPFKTAGAMDGFVNKPELALRVDDLNVGSNAIKNHPSEFQALVNKRKALGRRTTMYTATENAPGSFSLSAPGESYWSMLYAHAKGGEGFLRWAYDSWVEDPLRDSTHNAFEAGDTFLIFPDERTAEKPVSKSSLRLEKMAEGIRDINKLKKIIQEVPILKADYDTIMNKIHDQYEKKSGRAAYLTEEAKIKLANDMRMIKEDINALTRRYIELKKTGTYDITSLTLQEGKILTLNVGDTYVLHPIFMPENILNNQLTWTTQNDEIATVNDSGEIVALRTGRVKITGVSKQDSSKKVELMLMVNRKEIDETARFAYYDFENLANHQLLNKWGERTGTLSDGELVDGIFGKALKLTRNQSVTFDTNTTLTNNWSVGYWIKSERIDSERQMVTSSEDGVRTFDNRMANGRIGVQVNKNRGGFLTFKTVLPENEWHHITWVNSPETGLSLFLDGSLVERNAWTKTNNFSAPIDVLGGFNGSIDELKIYNRALSDQEVLTLTLREGINIAEESVIIPLEETYTLNVDLVTANEDKTLTFTSSDENIASVDEFGTIHGHLRGEVMITVTHAATGLSKTVPVFVKKQLATHHNLPVYRLPDENIVDIEKSPGTDRQYLGQPDLLLLKDNQTLLVVYPKGHGSGPLIARISRDGGKTWEDKTDIPASWEYSYETPTTYRLKLKDGTEKFILITGRPNWHGNTEGGWKTSLSDDGENWSEYREFLPNLPDGTKNWSITPMASLVQLKDEKGNFIDKWMGVYHDYNYVNYKTYLTFDENGQDVWSEPEPYLSDYRDLESSHQICEVGMFRSPDGQRIVALARTQSHQHRSLMFYSDDEGKTWSRPEELPDSLQGERHKITYDPISGRLYITFREIILDYNRNDKIEPGDWKAGEWVAWVGTYEDLMNQDEGQYRILLREDWANNPKSGDTGYAGIVTLPDGTFLTNSYGHWDKEFSLSWKDGVTTDLAYIKLANFKLGQADQALGLVNKQLGEDYLASLSKMDTNRFTKESLEVMNLHRMTMRNLLNSTNSQQIEIDKALKLLKETVANLVELPKNDSVNENEDILENGKVEVPKTAPTVEVLPSITFEVPKTAPTVEVLPSITFEVPKTAPTVEVLPSITFEVPKTASTVEVLPSITLEIPKTAPTVTDNTVPQLLLLQDTKLEQEHDTTEATYTSEKNRTSSRVRSTWNQVSNSATVGSLREGAETLPNTGEENAYLIFSAAVMAVLSSVGLGLGTKKGTV